MRYERGFYINGGLADRRFIQHGEAEHVLVMAPRERVKVTCFGVQLLLVVFVGMLVRACMPMRDVCTSTGVGRYESASARGLC